MSKISRLAVHPLRANTAYSLLTARSGQNAYGEPIMSKSRHRESCIPVGDLRVAEFDR